MSSGTRDSEGARGSVAALAVVTALLGALLDRPVRRTPSPAARPRSRCPYDLAAFGGVRFDPTTVPSPDDWYVQQWIYDSLLRQNADGSYSPGLAKSATVVDPQTIEIELRPNHEVLRRHAARRRRGEVQHRADHGVGQRRLRSAPSSTRSATSRSTARPSSRSTLATPMAGQFYNLLANGETYIVSPTAVKSGTSLDEKPVGAGPFVLESFTPESSAVFVRNQGLHRRQEGEDRPASSWCRSPPTRPVRRR